MKADKHTYQPTAFGYKSWHLIRVVVVVGTQPPEGGTRAKRRNGVVFKTKSSHVISLYRISMAICRSHLTIRSYSVSV